MSAPFFFRTQYDTSKTFTWALAGFNLMKSSFFPDGERTEDALHNLCLGSLLYDFKRPQRH